MRLGASLSSSTRAVDGRSRASCARTVARAREQRVHDRRPALARTAPPARAGHGCPAHVRTQDRYRDRRSSRCVPDRSCAGAGTPRPVPCAACGSRSPRCAKCGQMNTASKLMPCELKRCSTNSLHQLEVRSGKALAAEAVLIGDHHQPVARGRERLQRREHVGHAAAPCRGDRPARRLASSISVPSRSTNRIGSRDIAHVRLASSRSFCSGLPILMRSACAGSSAARRSRTSTPTA